ncbi:MAG: hypothetical protein JWN72_214 [Thermoleophilia bacterium]|nr:hypothetical protein [Thermoleophilia bacterium]
MHISAPTQSSAAAPTTWGAIEFGTITGSVITGSKSTVERGVSLHAAAAIKGRDQFVGLGNVSFQDAVKAAYAFGTEAIGERLGGGVFTGSKITVRPAVAVLQAADGAYFATLLARAENDKSNFFAPGLKVGPSKIQWSNVKATSDALKAIIGAEKYYDLTGPTTKFVKLPVGV